VDTFNPKHRKELDISLGSIFASRDDGGSVDIQEMCQSPTDRSLNDCDVSAGQYAAPVVLLLDQDINGAALDVVAFHGDDAPYRLRLIERAIEALDMTREALTDAHHTERWEFPLKPDLVYAGRSA